MTIVGIHHAGIYVTSLERSMAFYRDVFGLELAERFAFGDEELAFLQLGAARLELIESAASSRSTGVLDHVAFTVEDLDVLVEHLRALGVALLDPAPVEVPQLGARILFCLGPDGERIELVERTTPAW